MLRFTNQLVGGAEILRYLPSYPPRLGLDVNVLDGQPRTSASAAAQLFSTCLSPSCAPRGNDVIPAQDG